jgi:predicted O-linked N-acetylglucosamine transferase (SPINDLY family)
MDTYGRGEMQQVIVDASMLLERHAGVEAVYVLLGAAHLSLAHYAQAEATFRAALAADIRQPAIYSNLGMAIAEQGRHGEALESYRAAIVLDPGRASAHNNLANALKSCGRLPEAIESYGQAVALDPAYADAFNNMGLALEMVGRSEEALAAYVQAITLNPNHAGALNNLGNVQTGLGDLCGAIASYERALALRPNYAEAHYNLGNVYRWQGHYAEAIAAYQSATIARPHYADAWAELGKTLGLLEHTDLAITTLGRALQIDPHHVAALSHRLLYQAHACEWTAFDDWTRIDPALTRQFPPFIALTFEDDPERQLARSRSWAKHHYSRIAALSPRPEPASDGRIRIGYFSADFHNHATLFLMAGMLRAHDRTRFSIQAFSYGPQADGGMREALLTHVDGFHEIGAMADREVAALAHDLGLDIAVDLKGHTQSGRMQLFSYRLAPVQVSFLGYPGTSGVDSIDYLIADRIVVPEAMSAHYSEQLLLLPDSYQPNDDSRPIADALPSRAECRLPDRGFVFCCFNQNYKITPREFAIWMRLLRQVEGSVLWLLRWNPLAEQNLRRAAEAHGVAPDRLVFAEQRSQAEHLSRLRHADLILDTFNVNAHTTASDALWAGIPVVTLAGRQFAARVCASLLEAVGLPELVTDTEHDYESLILAIASEPDRLAAIRTRLEANRLTRPLFDTTTYVRNLEAAFLQIHERRFEGLPVRTS